MAVLPPGKGSQRRPSFRGNILQDTTRGVERTRIWPEPKGSRQTKGQLEQQEWFRQVNWAFKFMAPAAQASFAKATKGTALYPRDLLSMIASGSFLAFKTDEGKVAYPVSYIQAVSESLDALGTVPGYTLVRGTEFWGVQPILPPTGALYSRITLSAPSTRGAGEATIPFNVATVNSLAAWNSLQPTRLTVPTGVTAVQLTLNAWLTNGGTTRMNTRIYKNGAVFQAFPGQTWVNDAGVSMVTGLIPVVPGDWFEARIQFEGGSTKTYQPSGTSFEMKFG